MVRSKFRLLTITEDFHHNPLVRYTFRPVMPKFHKDDPGDTAEENKVFWQATPSGELELAYRESKMPRLIGGACYYVDLVELDDEHAWRVQMLTQMSGTLEVSFAAHQHGGDDLFQYGRLKLGINNRKAWPIFEGKIGKTFGLDLTKAG